MACRYEGEEIIEYRKGGDNMGKIVEYRDKRKKECDDQCDHCLYIGEGDFICDIDNDIVISEWMSIKGTCDKED